MAGKALPLSPGPWDTREVGIFFTTITSATGEHVGMINARLAQSPGNLALLLGAERLAQGLYDFLAAWNPTNEEEKKQKAKLALLWKEVRGVK